MGGCSQCQRKVARTAAVARNHERSRKRRCRASSSVAAAGYEPWRQPPAAACQAASQGLLVAALDVRVLQVGGDAVWAAVDGAEVEHLGVASGDTQGRGSARERGSTAWRVRAHALGYIGASCSSGGQAMPSRWMLIY